MNKYSYLPTTCCYLNYQIKNTKIDIKHVNKDMRQLLCCVYLNEKNKQENMDVYVFQNVKFVDYFQNTNSVSDYRFVSRLFYRIYHWYVTSTNVRNKCTKYTKKHTLLLTS